MAGLTFAADNALLSHEAQERDMEGRIRTLARAELARQGIMPTETEISRWKEQLKAEYYANQVGDSRSATATDTGATAATP